MIPCGSSVPDFRVLTQDDPSQSRKVNKLFESCARDRVSIFVSSIVVIELVWVLESAFKMPKKDVCAAITKVLQGDLFTFENHSVMIKAMILYENSPADYSDYVILLTGEEAGCKTLKTFDKKLLKHRFCT